MKGEYCDECGRKVEERDRYVRWNGGLGLRVFCGIECFCLYLKERCSLRSLL